jgi:phosphoribosyl 1,2-cyclic phosphate phosphodiesterase
MTGKSKLTFTVLGCGNSMGTPTIGNHWGACDPKEKRNYRTRASAVIRSAETTLLIDSGPDLREQANRENLTNVDAVFYTHAHADHVHGIEELRVFRLRHNKTIPIYGDQLTMDELQERFAYLFIERYKIYPKVCEPNVLHAAQMNTEFTIGDITIIPFEQGHGTCMTLGVRVGDLAYSTDMVELGQPALETLIGIKTWIVDAAAYKMEQNMVHATLQKVMDYNQIIGAEQVFLTHMPPSMDYQTLVRELPKGYAPSHDGISFEIN